MNNQFSPKQSAFIKYFEKTVSSSIGELTGGIVAAVSGGADSVAMLRAMVTCGYTILVIHCNFHLRGEESNHDAEFTANLCKKLGVECIIRDFDVSSRKLETGESTEMACRSLRYDFFRQIAALRGFSRIAVAHNRDDNSETMLLNLFRGTGIEGMKGMVADTGEIIRPMLSLTRKEIEIYLSLLEQDFVTDSTNLTSDYRRNFIRRDILPLIRREWPGIDQSLARSRRNMENVAAIYRQSIEDALPDGNILTYDIISKYPSPSTLVFEFVRRFGAGESIASEICRTLLPAFKQHSNQISGKMWFTKQGEIHLEREFIEFIPLNRNVSMPKLVWKKFPNTDQIMKIMISENDNRSLWTSLDPGEFKIRIPRPGDRIAPLGMNGSVLISKIAKDAKLSAAEKKSMFVIVDAEDKVVWIPGIKRSRYHIVNHNTAVIYRAEILDTSLNV